jgi:hypothetical protein
VIRSTARSLLALGALVGALAGAAEASDPGLVLDLDRERFELGSFDARSGEAGPRVRIVLGSPANETPDGDHRVGRVILNPAWQPSEAALESGAEWTPPSLDSPMGVAKIPFAATGSIALHGGGDLMLLGKPVSGGCVRARDADLLRILAWLLEQGALGPPVLQPDGEVHRSFQRRVVLRVHSGDAPPPAGAESP